MAHTNGYVATIESETEGVARLWFGLRSESSGGEWVTIGPTRAWFMMNMESADRPSHMAQLTLLLEAMRSGLHVQVAHGGATPEVSRYVDGDTFEVEGLRVIRVDLHFSE